MEIGLPMINIPKDIYWLEMVIVVHAAMDQSRHVYKVEPRTDLSVGCTCMTYTSPLSGWCRKSTHAEHGENDS